VHVWLCCVCGEIGETTQRFTGYKEYPSLMVWPGSSIATFDFAARHHRSLLFYTWQGHSSSTSSSSSSDLDSSQWFYNYLPLELSSSSSSVPVKAENVQDFLFTLQAIG